MLTILIVVGVALSCVGIFGLVIYGGQKKKFSHITKAKIVKVDVSTKRSGADKWEEIRPTLEYQVIGSGIGSNTMRHFQKAGNGRIPL